MTSLLPAALAVGLITQAMTGAKPDFSGTWTMDRERSESAMQEQPIRSMTVAITLTATTVTVETTRDGKPEVATYTIEEKPSGPGAIGAGTRRAYWDGAKLVTEGAGNVQGQTVSVREARTLNASAHRDDGRVHGDRATRVHVQGCEELRDRQGRLHAHGALTFTPRCNATDPAGCRAARS